MAIRLKASSRGALFGAIAATVGASWIGIGAASASASDPTGGGATAQVGTSVAPAVTTVHYIAYLDNGAFTYNWRVKSNHTARSSLIPPDGFVGTWTWTQSGKQVTFTETNGSGCIWTAKKTRNGYNSAAHQGVAECGGTDYSWYAVRKS